MIGVLEFSGSQLKSPPREPWRAGGPTHVDNGILLCYWHHQRVDDGPWHYRMTNGLPEIRGPGIPEWTRLSTPLRAAA